MRHFWLVALLVALASLPALAVDQYAPYNGSCEQGGWRITTNGIQSSERVERSFPACTVTVFDHGTVTPSTIFSDAAGTIPLANPFTATSTGVAQWYAADGRYDVQYSGTGIATPFTVSDIHLCFSCTGGGGGGVTGSGTTNIMAKWTSSSAIGNSAWTDTGTTATYAGTTITINNGVVGNLMRLQTGSFGQGLRIQANNGTTAVPGGGIDIISGSGSAAGEPAGTISITAGTGGSTAAGGAVTISAGPSASVATGAAGDLTLITQPGTSGGDIIFNPTNGAPSLGPGNTRWLSRPFANLGTPTNGSVAYCADCQRVDPCTGGGSGAFAKRLNGAWSCSDAGGGGAGNLVVAPAATQTAQGTAPTVVSLQSECPAGAASSLGCFRVLDNTGTPTTVFQQDGRATQTGYQQALGFQQTLKTVTFSSTPTFDLATGNVFIITLTGNVTGPTLVNAPAASLTTNPVTFIIVQDSAGAHSFTWPTNVFGGTTIDTTVLANARTMQSFVYDGANFMAISPGVTTP